jgi:hypothetical protein
MPPIVYEEVKARPPAFRAMTGLTVKQFEDLLVLFEEAWKKTHVADPFGRGRTPKIANMSDRLFFILYYFRCYPVQEVLGYLFGISQEKACEYVKEFTDVVLMAMRESNLAPERVSDELKKNLNQIQKRITSVMESNDRFKGPKTP